MKKKITIWSLIMLSTVELMSTELNITIDNIDINRDGNIRVYIFGEKGYPKVHEEAFMSQVKMVKKEKLNFIFEIPDEVNELAIKVFHDENDDEKVTKNWTRIIPKEGLGFSNKQKLNFGPPSYKNSKLSKTEFIKKQIISIIYP